MEFESIVLKKKDYVTQIKLYMKKMVEYLEKNSPDRVEEFKKGAQKMVKFIMEKYQDFEFYVDREMKEGAMPICCYWENDSDAGPTFLFFKDGIKETKY